MTSVPFHLLQAPLSRGRRKTSVSSNLGLINIVTGDDRRKRKGKTAQSDLGNSKQQISWTKFPQILVVWGSGIEFDRIDE